MAIAKDKTYQKFSELRGQYGRYHAQMRRARRLYDRDFERDVISAGARARGFKPVVPQTARRIIDEAADHVLYYPKVHVPARPTESKHTTEEQIAAKKREAITAYWRQIDQRYNVLGDGRKWLFLNGKIAVKHTLRWDLVPDKESPTYRRDIERLGRYEFMWQDELLDPEWVYEDPSDHRNPAYVFLSYSMYAEAAKKKFPSSVVGAIGQEWRLKPDYSKVNYLEYWSEPTWQDDGSWEPGEYRQFIETDCVTDDDNPYPYVPIAIEDSGYGLNHLGIEIEKRFVGLLDHAESVLIAQARQWTAMEAVAELTAFNPIEARNIGDEKLVTLDLAPGAVWQLDGNPAVDTDAETMEMKAFPAIPITVLQMLQLTDREVNSTQKTDNLGGIAQKGVDTATEADQNVRNSAAKLSGPVAALQRLAAKLTRWFLMDIELVLEAPVTLYGTTSTDPAAVTLTPTEIGGYWDCFVELRTSDEEAMDMTRAKLWADIYNMMPMLSAWTALEAGGMTDDPLGEMLRRASENVFMSPEFEQIRIATGAESFGELAAYIQQLIAQKEQGGGGGAATPTPQETAGPPEMVEPTTLDQLNDPTAQTVQTGYDNRDVQQAASAYGAQ
jgi:hypothetical protein